MVLTRDPERAVPLLWRSEFRNVLAGLVHRKALAVEDAIRITGVAEDAMRGRESAVVSHEVLSLAARSGCSAYDCEYVALAQDLGVRLVTADQAVLRAFPAVAVAPQAFVA